MCEFIHYKYRPKYLHSINYNPTLINYLLQYSKNIPSAFLPAIDLFLWSVSPVCFLINEFNVLIK